MQDALLKKLRQPEIRHALFIAALFAACVLTAFTVRTWHYNREAARLAVAIGDIQPGDPKLSPTLWDFLPFTRHNFMPYTIESGMMYSYTQDIASGKGVPRSDKGLPGMEDLTPWSQMNMGLEWFLGYGYRLKSLLFKDGPYTPEQTRFESNPGLAQWSAAQIRLWASLTTGFIFLWLIVLKCPWRLALIGGALHAVALSAVARSTGQDLVRGEFCIPLITASILLGHWLYSRGSWWKALLLFMTTALAFATWDLCQMLFGCWALFEIARIALGGKVTAGRRIAWFAIYMAIAFNALFVPFHKVYLLLQSPLMLVAMPTLMLLLFKGYALDKFWKRVLLAIGCFVVLHLVWGFAVRTPAYDSVYSHFGEVMRAKVKFMNDKPADPRLLSFDARIMWTPSMHSATWPIAASFFPTGSVLLPVPLPEAVKGLWYKIPFMLGLFSFTLLGGLLFGRTRRAIVRGLPRSLMPYLFTFGFMVGFTLVVRYHEFVILFLCVSLPLLAQDFLRGLRDKPRGAGGLGWFGEFKGVRAAVAWLFVCAILYGMALEGICSFVRGQRAYSGDIYMRQTAQLIQWFRSCGLEGRNIITDFTVGPMLKAYCGMGIAMQPQWGIERIRRPTEIYLNIMYHGTERELNEFCLKYNADYLLYDKGYVGPLHIYSNRYIAAAVDIRGESMANMMYYWPDNLKWFYRIDPPKEFKELSVKFSVFKVIKPQDRLDSIKMVWEGGRALSAGDALLAGRLAKTAIWLDPFSAGAKAFYFKVFGRVPVIALDKPL